MYTGLWRTDAANQTTPGNTAQRREGKNTFRPVEPKSPLHLLLSAAYV